MDNPSPGNAPVGPDILPRTFLQGPKGVPETAIKWLTPAPKKDTAAAAALGMNNRQLAASLSQLDIPDGFEGSFQLQVSNIAHLSIQIRFSEMFYIPIVGE